MKRALFVIANNYRGNRAVREMNVGPDMVGLGGFFEQVARYDIVEIVQDKPLDTVLAELEAVVDRLSSGDLLVVYFCGHGVRTSEHLLILPVGKSNPVGAPFGFLPVAELRRQTEGRGLMRAIILDACWNADARSAAVTTSAEYTREIGLPGSRDVSVSPLPSVPKQSAGDSGSFAILCACSEDEVAPELGRTGKGLFSTSLQNVLKQEKASRRIVRVDDKLRDEVEAEMHRLAKKYGIVKTPKPWKAGNGTPVILGVGGRRIGLGRKFWIAAAILLGTSLAIAATLYYFSKPPLGMQWYGFGQRQVNGTWTEFPVRESVTMYDGDQYRIAFSPTSDCYVYAVCFNSDGTVSCLFPNAAIRQSNFCRRGQQYEIPDGINWFTLDANPGAETLYLIASYDSLTGLESAINQAAASKQSAAIEALRDQIAAITHQTIEPQPLLLPTRSGIVVRGISIQPDKRIAHARLSTGEEIQRPMDLTPGRAAVVQRIRIDHEHKPAVGKD